MENKFTLMDDKKLPLGKIAFTSTQILRKLKNFLILLNILFI